MHSHLGTELLTLIKDLSFNTKIYFHLGTTLEDNFKRKLKKFTTATEYCQSFNI